MFTIVITRFSMIIEVRFLSLKSSGIGGICQASAESIARQTDELLLLFGKVLNLHSATLHPKQAIAWQDIAGTCRCLLAIEGILALGVMQKFQFLDRLCKDKALQRSASEECKRKTRI